MLIVTLCVAVVALLGAADCNPAFRGRATCPSGWMKYGRRCFRVEWTPRTWAQAETNCLNHGANLVSVHSSGEYHWLHQMTTAATWMGGFDATQEGWWFWSDGSRMSYRNWAQGEPNNHKSRQDCLAMNHGGRLRWDDKECSDRLPSVCVGRL